MTSNQFRCINIYSIIIPESRLGVRYDIKHVRGMYCAYIVQSFRLEDEIVLLHGI